MLTTYLQHFRVATSFSYGSLRARQLWESQKLPIVVLCSRLPQCSYWTPLLARAPPAFCNALNVSNRTPAYGCRTCRQVAFLAIMSTSADWTRRRTPRSDDWIYLPTVYPADCWITMRRRGSADASVAAP